MNLEICPDGSLSGGTCSNGTCGSDYNCISSIGLCCPNRICLDGSIPVGTCVKDQCAPGYFCSSTGYCCLLRLSQWLS